MPNELLYAGIGIVAAYQIYVTLKVSKADLYNRAQKVAQALLIWLIPLAGAVTCHIFILADKESSLQKDRTFAPDGGDSPLGTGTVGSDH